MNMEILHYIIYAAVRVKFSFPIRSSVVTMEAGRARPGIFIPPHLHPDIPHCVFSLPTGVVHRRVERRLLTPPPVPLYAINQPQGDGTAIHPSVPRNWSSLLITISLIYALIMGPVEFAFIDRFSSVWVLAYMDHFTALFLFGHALLDRQYIWNQLPDGLLKFVCKDCCILGAFLAWFPWILIFGHIQGVRFILLSRLYYIYSLYRWAPIIPYMFGIRRQIWIAVKILFIEILAFHVTACFFYFLATTEDDPSNTWLGSVKLGKTDYSQFRMLSFGEVYSACFYYATMTLTTVGYGDFHAVNVKEMLCASYLVIANVGFAGYISGVFNFIFS